LQSEVWVWMFGVWQQGGVAGVVLSTLGMVAAGWCCWSGVEYTRGW